MFVRVSFLNTFFSLFFDFIQKWSIWGTPFQIQWASKWHLKSTKSSKRTKKNIGPPHFGGSWNNFFSWIDSDWLLIDFGWFCIGLGSILIEHFSSLRLYGTTITEDRWKNLTKQTHVQSLLLARNGSDSLNWNGIRMFGGFFVYIGTSEF